MAANTVAYIEIWFWSNCFMVLSRCFGVTQTIQAIHRLVRLMPACSRSLDDVSAAVDAIWTRMPFLIVANKQKCLVRGLLLFFFGKRMRRDIRLCFGCQWEMDELKTHCWIVVNQTVRFEVDEVIQGYETLVDYT